MEFALWAYPWDILDEGVESVAERCTELGVDEINLSTNYHAVQSFLPHNPERTTFFAHASSYFQPDEDRYGRLSPVPNETMGEVDWLDRITDEICDTHLSLNSWTIGCHNSRLGMNNPDLTLESPFGDSLAFGLCPSKPEVQEFLTALLSDLTARAPFDRIEFETFDYFYGTGFGWHHDKYHADLGRLGEFLFGLCFCEDCCENAREAGIDVNAARDIARDGLSAIIDGNLSPETDALEWVGDRALLAAYVDARTETLTDLYADLRRAVGHDADLGRYIGFFEVDDAWMHGVNLADLADDLDYYTVIAYESDRASAVSRVETAAELAPDIPLHAGVLPGHPAINDAQTVCDVVDGLAETGVERVSFYNYGLLPERSLDWIGEATEQHR